VTVLSTRYEWNRKYVMTDIDEEKIRKLDGTLLLVLRELLRQQRTTRVANRLGSSQSAVSHALARLRAIFDDPLFVRRPHGLEPTPRARELGPKVDAILAAMSDAIGDPQRFDARTTTHDFRVGAPDHLATLLAPSLLQVFGSEAPRSRFAFSQQLGQDALTALDRHELDLAVGRFAGRIDRAFVVESLFDDEYCLIARRDHPRIGRRVTAAVYAELDHIQVSIAGDFRGLEIERVGTGAVPRHTVAAVPRFLMAFPIVAASDAVALAPRRLAERHGRSFGISAHAVPVPLEPIRVLVVRRARRDRAVAWLLDRVRQLDVVA
jgi:DNA-binding transcriptional LysR family regulator